MSLPDDVLRTVEMMVRKLSDEEIEAGDAVAVCADRFALSDEKIEASLRALGRSPLAARLLVQFVPMGFGRIIIEGMENRPRDLPGRVDLVGRSTDRVYSLPLADIPQYMAARDLAIRLLQEGSMPFEDVYAVAARGAELRCLWDGMQREIDMTRSQFSRTAFCGMADVPGFREWYKARPSRNGKKSPVPRKFDGVPARLPAAAEPAEPQPAVAPSTPAESWSDRLRSWWPWTSRR